MKIDNQSITVALAKTEADFAGQINHNDHLFLKRIFGNGIEKYRNRLRAIGFYGLETILDAGCGYGQWSLALSEMNESVVCCDSSVLRIKFLERLAKYLGISNLRCEHISIENTPYADTSFDAIFCYQAIYCTPWKKTLKEFERILRPGARIYLCANSLGWYVFLYEAEHNKAFDYDPKEVAAYAMLQTLNYDRKGFFEMGSNLIIEKDAMISELENLGLTVVQAGSEGSIHTSKSEERPIPFFASRYCGLDTVFEVLALN
jgi:SAM-dependent methyltransferase